MQFVQIFKKTAAILACMQFFFCFFLVVPIVLLLDFISKKFQIKLPVDSTVQKILQKCFSFYISMMEISVEIEKPKNFSFDDSPYIYLHTHASIIDNVGQFKIQNLPFSYLAKKELFKVPFVNLYLKFFKAVPIDRNNLQAAISSFKKLQKQTDVGRNVMIAPEGTRRRKLSTADGDNIQPFKKGPFYFAKNSQLPLVPMIFNGGSRLMNVGKLFPQSDPIMPSTYKDMTPSELKDYTEKYFKDNYEFKSDEEVYKSTKNSLYTAIGFYLLNGFFIYKLLFQIIFYNKFLNLQIQQCLIHKI